MYISISMCWLYFSWTELFLQFFDSHLNLVNTYMHEGDPINLVSRPKNMGDGPLCYNLKKNDSKYYNWKNNSKYHNKILL